MKKPTFLLLCFFVINLGFSQKQKDTLGLYKKFSSIFQYPDELISKGKSVFVVLEYKVQSPKNCFSFLNFVDSSTAQLLLPMLSEACIKAQKMDSKSDLVIPIIFLCSNNKFDQTDINANSQNVLSYFQSLSRNKNKLTLQPITFIGMGPKK